MTYPDPLHTDTAEDIIPPEQVKEVKARLNRELIGLGRITETAIKRFPPDAQNQLWAIIIYLMKVDPTLLHERSPLQALRAGDVAGFRKSMQRFFSHHTS